MMMTKRVDALEQRKGDQTPVVIPLTTAAMGQPRDVAVARHVDEHGPLPDVGEGQINVIVMVPAAPRLGLAA